MLLVAIFVIAPFYQSSFKKEVNSPKTPLQNTQKNYKEGNLTNEEMIQKNIDFIKNNLDSLKKENNTTKEANNIEDLQKQNAVLAEDLQVLEKPKIQETCQREKPQLAIIIDDVANKTQLERVLNLPFKVTPSLFPKSEASKNTPLLAKSAPFYMVHLPLEAKNFYQKEHEWLRVGDSKEKIIQRIKEIKKDFPNLAYLNNHTGSKFTEDLTSMQYLLDALNKEGIIFLDSKTTPKSVTQKYYQDKFRAFNPCYKNPFLQRDVFLDNELEEEKIAIALKNSIKVAKKKGYAIAIGHPHPVTIKTLKNMEGFLKKSGVELVYVNELITKYDTISKK